VTETGSWFFLICVMLLKVAEAKTIIKTDPVAFVFTKRQCKCHFNIVYKIIGEFLDTCRISATLISAPKGLTVLLNINILFFCNQSIYLDLRYVSWRCDECKKFQLNWCNFWHLSHLSNPYLSSKKIDHCAK